MSDPTKFDVVMKHLTFPEARSLEDLCVLRTDLEISLKAMTLYFDKFHQTGATFDPRIDEHVISMSLYRDAIILYTGCFSKTDESKLKPEAVYDHISDWEKLCNVFLDLRDSFIAHNFGAHRQHDVGVALVVENDELKFGSITNTAIRHLGFSANERDRILGWIDIAQKHVADLIKPHVDKLERKIKAMTQDELAALPEPSAAHPMQHESRLSRSKFRAKADQRKQPYSFRLTARKLEGMNDPQPD